MKLLILLGIGTLAAGLGCQSTASTEVGATENPTIKSIERVEDNELSESEMNLEKAKRISLADAKKDFDAGDAVFVDTRAKVFFENEHIKGAVNVPSSDFEDNYSNAPKDKKIIAYCS